MKKFELRVCFEVLAYAKYIFNLIDNDRRER